MKGIQALIPWGQVEDDRVKRPLHRMQQVTQGFPHVLPRRPAVLRQLQEVCQVIVPCQAGMAGCKRGCLHRQMVMEYRLARHAQEMQMEETTLGHETEIHRYLEENPLITFQEWLEGLKQNQ